MLLLLGCCQNLLQPCVSLQAARRSFTPRFSSSAPAQSSFTLPTAYQGAPLLLRLWLLVLPLEALSRPTVPALQDGDGSRRQGLGHGHRDRGQLQRQPLGALPVGLEGQRRHLVAPISWLAVGATLGIGSPHL